MVYGPLPDKAEIRSAEGFRAAHAAQEAATKAYLLEGNEAEHEALRAAMAAFATVTAAKVADAHDPQNAYWPDFVAGMVLELMRAAESEAWVTVCNAAVAAHNRE